MPRSLSNRSVSRVQIGRGFSGGQLCVFVWLGGFWVAEEELYVPSARAVPQAAAEWCPGGQRGATGCLEVLPLKSSKLSLHNGHFSCFTEGENSSTVWL